MFHHDKRLQCPVRVSRPDPVHARMLQQAIGGVEDNHDVLDTGLPGSEAPAGRWASGPARPDSGAETRQIG